MAARASMSELRANDELRLLAQLGRPEQLSGRLNRLTRSRRTSQWAIDTFERLPIPRARTDACCRSRRRDDGVGWSFDFQLSSISIGSVVCLQFCDAGDSGKTLVVGSNDQIVEQGGVGDES